jgi:pyruvate ferredoxin oxidoreductase gamma subunit
LIEVRWHGRGGQGVVTAAKILASAALRAGRHIQAFPEFGPERRGSPVQAFTRIDDAPIRLFQHVSRPDVVVVLDRSLVGKIPFTEGLKKEGTLVVNTKLSPGKLRKVMGIRHGRFYTVNATELALKYIGRPITNMPMLGAFLKATNLIDIEMVIKELEETFAKKMSVELVEGNIQALKKAYQVVKSES